MDKTTALARGWQWPVKEAVPTDTAGLRISAAAGEQILPRRTAAAISALFDGQVCHVLSAAEVTEQEMIADGVEDPIRVPGMPLVAPERPGRPDEDGEE